MFDPKTDGGCEVNPVPLGCFTCPLPECKWDLEPGELVRTHQNAKDDAMLAMMEEEGLTIEEVAEREGQIERTIYRRLARIRDRASRERGKG